jgi:glutamate 5-kinase
VPVVTDVSKYLDVTDSVSALGSGGMLTKMMAANMAQNAGCTTLIAKGEVDRPLTEVLNGSRQHTKCIANGDPDSSWRIWLTDRLQQAGGLDRQCGSGRKAARNLRVAIEGQDLISIQGEFTKGDVLQALSMTRRAKSSRAA